MKIRVEHVPIEENEVVLRCKELDEEMLEIVSLLRERIAKLAVYKDGETHMLTPADILYAESVDGKTFICTKENVYDTAGSLTQLEAAYEGTGMLRISKSQIVNLYKVESLKSLPNSRVQIVLQNGERLVVSRHYVQALKTKLGIEQKGDWL